MEKALFDDGGLDRLLQLLEGAHLDLAHPLARDAVLLRQILKGGRVIAQAPLGQDVAFAIVQMHHRLFEQIAAELEFLPPTEPGLLALALVDEPILLSAFAVAPWQFRRKRLNHVSQRADSVPKIAPPSRFHQFSPALLTYQGFSHIGNLPQNASSFVR